MKLKIILEIDGDQSIREEATISDPFELTSDVWPQLVMSDRKASEISALLTQAIIDVMEKNMVCIVEETEGGNI